MTPTKMLLLAEDEALVKVNLKEGLTEAGFDVMDFGKAEEALSEIEADVSRFSGLITDVRLGKKGPDGWEIARRARELNTNIPVVYISGHGSTDWPSKGVPGSVVINKRDSRRRPRGELAPADDALLREPSAVAVEPLHIAPM